MEQDAKRVIVTAVRPINEDIGMLRGFPLLVYVSSVHESMPYPSLQTITARAIGRSQGSLPFLCMGSWNATLDMRHRITPLVDKTQKDD
ncbi:hypothetical protein F9C07_6306 [Aspergillus flavus]|uniref:Uncharacterized protein n=1 Tax=Aspergillus flavus (strain ATCC 200026 / FGSC A1120 / IAM 13836 / NRRL 3357 / JCM 12722 / SRRC 167) TaxID=332952 RepID=A0A7U2MI15_ASPFN|nr:hypothetical protein F9C07_6306 [Aspergillus flavus]